MMIKNGNMTQRVKEEIQKEERKQRIEKILNDKELLVVLPLIGFWGLLKSLALLIALTAPSVESTALNYSPWWIVTVPLLLIFRIPEVANFWEAAVAFCVKFFRSLLWRLESKINEEVEKRKFLKFLFDLI